MPPGAAMATGPVGQAMHSWLPTYHPWLVTSHRPPCDGCEQLRLKGLILPRRPECHFSCVFIFLCVEEGNPEIDRERSFSKGTSLLAVFKAPCHSDSNIHKTEQNAQKTGKSGLDSGDLCHRRWAKKDRRRGCLLVVRVTFGGCPKSLFWFFSNILHKHPKFLANPTVWKSPLLTFQVHLLALLFPCVLFLQSGDQRTVCTSRFTNQMSNLSLVLTIKTFPPHKDILKWKIKVAPCIKVEEILPQRKKHVFISLSVHVEEFTTGFLIIKITQLNFARISPSLPPLPLNTHNKYKEKNKQTNKPQKTSDLILKENLVLYFKNSASAKMKWQNSTMSQLFSWKSSQGIISN